MPMQLKFYPILCLPAFLFLIFTLVGCTHAEIRDYSQLQQSFEQIDSIGIAEYTQPIELRQEVLGKIKSFLAAYPKSRFADSLKVLHETYMEELQHLTAEQQEFVKLKEQVDKAETASQIEECHRDLSAFIVSYPNCPMKSELDDINLYLNYLKNIAPTNPDSILNLKELNTLLDQCHILLKQLHGISYKPKIEHRIRMLESKLHKICDQEINTQIANMEHEMEAHATNLLRLKCTCLKLPKTVKRFVGFKTPDPIEVNSNRNDELSEISITHTYQYLAPYGFLCSETALFAIETKGVINKNCKEGISYQISAIMPNPPILKE